MAFKSALHRNTTLAAGIALALGLSRSSQAAVNISLAVGGSSALLGNFTTTNSTVAEGALPQIIGQLGTIAGYNPNGVTETVFALASSAANPVTITRDTPNASGSALSGTATENPTDIEIRVVDQGNGNVNAILLARSDSGFGVRYIANNARVTGLPANPALYNVVTPATGASRPATAADFTFGGVDALNGAGGLVSQAGGAGIRIDTGLSDVAADTVIRYSGVFGNAGPTGVFVPNLNTGNITFARTPIQTLLTVYNSNVYAGAAFPVNFTRSQVRGLIAGYPDPAQDTPTWSEIDGRLRADLFVASAFRETTSGTRLTQFTNIQRYGFSSTQALTENSGGFITNPGMDTTTFQHALGITAKNDPTGMGATYSGTGDILGAVNAGYQNAATGSFVNGATFGYAFVTGTAGNTRGSARVATFNGVAPYAGTSGADISLPNNNGQTPYGNANYYTETASGRYELWAYSRAIFNSSVRTSTGTFNAVFGQLNSATSTFSNIVHRNGLTQLIDMRATRSSAAGVFVAQEPVQDGLFVNLDTTNAVNFANVLD